MSAPRAHLWACPAVRTPPGHGVGCSSLEVPSEGTAPQPFLGLPCHSVKVPLGVRLSHLQPGQCRMQEKLQFVRTQSSPPEPSPGLRRSAPTMGHLDCIGWLFPKLWNGRRASVGGCGESPPPLPLSGIAFPPGQASHTVTRGPRAPWFL